MKNFFTLLNREVNSYFYSPIAYVVLCFFLFLMGLNTWLMIAGANNNAIDVTQGTLVQSFFSGAIFWYPFILIFPLITMRVFAEEFRMGTIETLTTAPVDDGAIVLSKYVGATLFACLLFIPSLLFYALFSWVGGHGTASFGGPYLAKAIGAVSHLIGGSGEATTTATGAYWTTYLLILLMTMFYCAIGCLASALTKDQINAAIISFSISVVLLFIGFVPQIVDLSGYVNMDDARKAQAYILPLAHMGDYSKGVIDSRPLVYYLSMTLFVMYLTYQVFQHRKWSDGGYPIFLVLGWLLLTSVALLALVFWHPMVAFLRERPVLLASLAGVVLIALALAVFTGSSKTFIRANVLLQLAVLTGIVLGANFLSYRHFKRWDFSRTKQYASEPAD